MKNLILLSIISIIIAAIMLRLFRPTDTIEVTQPEYRRVRVRVREITRPGLFIDPDEYQR